MPAYNKLKIAILATLSSQNIYALSFDPIEVQSEAGNLLYAEMKFRNANPNLKIEASLADPQDILDLGITSQALGHFNLFTRKYNDGSGAIVITSAYPVFDTQLDLLLKIKEGESTHLRQIRTYLNGVKTPRHTALSINEKSLQPLSINSEADIALNAPAHLALSTNETALQPLSIDNENDIALSTPINAKLRIDSLIQASQSIPVEAIESTEILSANTDTIESTIEHSIEPTIERTLVINTGPAPSLGTLTQTENKVQKSITEPYPVALTTLSIDTKSESKPANSGNVAILAQSVPIQATLKNESITTHVFQELAQLKLHENILEKSAISNKNQHTLDMSATPVSQYVNLSTAVKTHASAQSNLAQSYVVQPNESLWGISKKIASQSHHSITEVMKKIELNNQHAFVGGNINLLRRATILNLASLEYTASSNASAVSKSNPSKQRINKLKTNSKDPSIQAYTDPSLKQKTQKSPDSEKLYANFMTAHQKTVRLRGDVSQLALTVQQKDQKVQVLNTRLAALQQQLQRQNQAKKSALRIPS